MQDESIRARARSGITINEADAKLLGRNLFVVRRRRGLSQDALAEGAGVSRHAIRKIEMGHRSPRIGTMPALADALGVDPAELLEGLRS